MAGVVTNQTPWTCAGVGAPSVCRIWPIFHLLLPLFLASFLIWLTRRESETIQSQRLFLPLRSILEGEIGKENPSGCRIGGDVAAEFNVPGEKIHTSTQYPLYNNELTTVKSARHDCLLITSSGDAATSNNGSQSSMGAIPVGIDRYPLRPRPGETAVGDRRTQPGGRAQSATGSCSDQAAS
jgi:hypothetical protein